MDKVRNHTIIPSGDIKIKIKSLTAGLAKSTAWCPE